MPERPTQTWTDFNNLLLASLNFPSGKQRQASVPEDNSIYLLLSGLTHKHPLKSQISTSVGHRPTFKTRYVFSCCSEQGFFFFY